MTVQRSTFTSPVDGLELAAYEWDVADPRGVVQVAHGLAEHSARYDRFARALNDAGYTVRACDHRGHGDSIDGAPGDFGTSGFAALEAFNVGFENRTGYEWLSRDEAEVDLYVADPLCGFDLPEETVPALFGGAVTLADPVALAGIRHDLPVLVASGSEDPLAGGGQLVQVLGQRYRDAGLVDVTVTVYDGARHEILNETNRDDVTADVIAWLDAHR